MPINKESLQRRLEKALGRYDPKAVNDNDEVIPLADEADAFRFQFTKDGENYGKVYVTLDDTHTLTVWFDDSVMDSPEAKTPGLDYDDTWTGFLKFLKRWAMNNQLSFKTDNRQHLGSEMARRKRMKEKENISEGYHAMGRKASYNDAIPNVKIVLQHSKVMEEGEQRFRHIEKIFVENQQGERFLVPTNRPGLARVFARHIAEGGTPYDERAGHIQSLVEEYNKMAGFVRATRSGQFDQSAQQLVQEGINHYLSLRESLSKMTGHKGYTAYFENWTPALMEDETDATAINELFVQETLDPRIESVMPILSRLHKQVAEMKEVSALDEWAESVLAEKMVMGADSDASSAGTVYVEDEGIQSNNPVGIPEEGKEDDLDEGKPGLWANIHAKRERIKHGSGERMRKPGSKGAPSAQDFKDAAKEGIGDVAKKVGGALKKVGSKALDTLGHGSDEELLKDLQKRAGVPSHAQHGKPSMAKPNESVEEDLDANQKRVGQLGPTEKVGKKGAVGKLVGANENFISMAPQAVAEGQEDLDAIKRMLGEGWKGELAGGTLGGVGGTVAGSALGTLVGGPLGGPLGAELGGAIGGVVGGAAGGTAGQMAGRELTKEEQLNEVGPLIAAGARALLPLLGRIGPALGRMASQAGKAAAPAVKQGAEIAAQGGKAIAQGAGQAAKAGAEIAAKNAVPIGTGIGAYSAITDIAKSLTGGVGEVYNDVASAAAALAKAVGNAVDEKTLLDLAQAAVKYALPIGIVIALLYGGKKLIDNVMAEDSATSTTKKDGDLVAPSLTQLAGQAVGSQLPNPNDFVKGFKQTFEGQEDLDYMLRIINK